MPEAAGAYYDSVSKSWLTPKDIMNLVSRGDLFHLRSQSMRSIHTGGLGVPAKPQVQLPEVKKMEPAKLEYAARKSGLDVPEFEEIPKLPERKTKLPEPIPEKTERILRSLADKNNTDFDDLADLIGERGWYELKKGMMNRMPVYRQNFINRTYSNFAWHHIRDVITSFHQKIERGQEVLGDERLLYDRLQREIKAWFKICSENYVGTGNNKLQIARMKYNQENYARSIIIRRDRDRKGITKALNQCWLKAKIRTTAKGSMPTDSINSPNYKVRTVFEKKEGGKYEMVEKTREIPIYKVHSQSESGPPNLAFTKKGDSLLSDLTLADKMIMMFRLFEKGRVKSSDIIDKFKWIAVHYGKGKEEVYNAKKGRNRNIYVGAACVQYVMEPLIRPVYLQHIGYLNSEKSMSLAGFSPARGRYHDIVWKMMNECDIGKPSCCSYADNIFYLHITNDEKMLWLSIDASSMESSHTREDQVSMFRYIFEQCYECTFNDNNFCVKSPHEDINRINACMFAAATMINPLLVINSLVIKLNGLATGDMWTFLMNDMKGSLAARRMKAECAGKSPTIKKDGKRELSKCVEEALLKEGFVPRLERATIIPTKPKHGGVENHGEILKLDLLGFDALPFEAGDRAVMLPVLNEDRLRKSILFEKSPERFADNEQMKLVMRLIKLKTMFILGAWAYEGLREATSILIDSTIQLLEMQSSETEDESVQLSVDTLTAMATSMNLTAEPEQTKGIMMAVAMSGIPKMDIVLEIMAPEGIARLFILDIMEKRRDQLTDLVSAERLFEMASRKEVRLDENEWKHIQAESDRANRISKTFNIENELITESDQILKEGKGGTDRNLKSMKAPKRKRTRPNDRAPISSQTESRFKEEAKRRRKGKESTIKEAIFQAERTLDEIKTPGDYRFVQKEIVFGPDLKRRLDPLVQKDVHGAQSIASALMSMTIASELGIQSRAVLNSPALVKRMKQLAKEGLIIISDESEMSVGRTLEDIYEGILPMSDMLEAFLKAMEEFEKDEE